MTKNSVKHYPWFFGAAFALLCGFYASYVVGQAQQKQLSFGELYAAPTYENLDNTRATAGVRPCAVDVDAATTPDAGPCEDIPTFVFAMTHLVPAKFAPCKSPGDTDCTPAATVVRTFTGDRDDFPEVMQTYQGFLGAFVQKHCPTDGSPSPCPEDRRKLGLTSIAWAPCSGEQLGAQAPQKGVCVVGEVAGLIGQDGKPAASPVRALIPLSPADAAAFEEMVETRLLPGAQ